MRAMRESTSPRLKLRSVSTVMSTRRSEGQRMPCCSMLRNIHTPPPIMARATVRVTAR